MAYFLALLVSKVERRDEFSTFKIEFIMFT